MNIKNISLSLFALISMAYFSFISPGNNNPDSPGNNNPEKVTYSVDVTNSTLEWLGKKVTGQHNGHIQLREGSLIVKNNEISGGTFIIDMTSITNEDIKDQEYNQKLVGHLKSDDFFGVEKHPVSTFKITNIQANGKDQYDVTGELTIKGISNEVTFPAEIDIAKDKITAEATIVVDRSKYDIRYGSGSFFDNLGDKTIYDDFELSLSLVASR